MRSRAALAVALALYSVFLAIVLFYPTSSDQSRGASLIADLGQALGMSPQLATQARAEFIANALILAPVSALGSLLWPRTDWRDWTTWAFVISGCVEVVQGLFLPARTASMADVVANTLGGLLGALFIVVVRRLWSVDGAERL